MASDQTELAAQPGRTDPARGPLRVAVIGTSLAGLFAAAAVSRAGHRAVLIERDHLGGSSARRHGVPQGEQPHVFLLRGLLATEELLPGLRADLESHGAVPFDSSRLAWLGDQGWTPTQTSGFEVISLTRPLFERVVRQHVLALDRVELRDGTTVKGLRRNASPDQLRWTVVTAVDGETIDADLVVDASGRGSRLPQWLAALGVSAPKVSEIDARIGYATREYQDGPDLAGLSGIVLQLTAASPRGGLVLPVENGHWLVLATGAGNARPPRDVAGFEAHLRRLPDPAVADFADRCTPCGEVIVYRRTGNRKYHYERQRDWPDGLLAIGDSFVAFNPVYGQGISVAACEALVLRDLLELAMKPGGARKVMRRFASATALPWSIAAAQDLRQPTSAGHQTRSQRLTNVWAQELTRLGIHGNKRAADVLASIYQLMAKPRVMLHPALFGAALRAKVVGYGPAAPRPAGLAAMVDA